MRHIDKEESVLVALLTLSPCPKTTLCSSSIENYKMDAVGTFNINITATWVWQLFLEYNTIFLLVYFIIGGPKTPSLPKCTSTDDKTTTTATVNDSANSMPSFKTEGQTFLQEIKEEPQY